jgi:GNAT superfamily N-acetyltransferase
MQVVCAEPTDANLKTVLGLLDEAASWLRTKDTDQWKAPWPNEEQRDGRVEKALKGSKTWIVWDRDVPAATVTIAKRANPAVWPKSVCDQERIEPAVYLHRLVTARDYAGLGLGADLIDWAGRLAARQYGAEWIRIDVWRSNKGLHEYYEKRGFQAWGYCADPKYPSGALFQKAISEISADSVPEFTVPPDARLA